MGKFDLTNAEMESYFPSLQKLANSADVPGKIQYWLARFEDQLVSISKAFGKARNSVVLGLADRDEAGEIIYLSPNIPSMTKNNTKVNQEIELLYDQINEIPFSKIKIILQLDDKGEFKPPWKGLLTSKDISSLAPIIDFEWEGL
jgi:hypothetical protein